MRFAIYDKGDGHLVRYGSCEDDNIDAQLLTFDPVSGEIVSKADVWTIKQIEAGVVPTVLPEEER